MSLSWVKICNFGLYGIGAAPIISIDDNTEGARACKGVYEQARDAILRMRVWNCALHQDTLTEDATAPEFGYDYRYLLPTDPYCLRLVQIKYNPPYVLMGRYIHCDLKDTIYITYIKRVTDPTQLDPLLAEAIGAKIGLDVAYRLSGSAQLRQQAYEIFNLKLSEAEMADANESPDLTGEQSTVLTVRPTYQGNEYSWE